MSTKFTCLLAISVAAGCQATPSLFDSLPDPLPRLADAEALVLANGLRVGDRLEFVWTSNLAGALEQAEIRVTVDEIGTPEEARGITEDEIEALRAAGRRVADELALPFPFRLEDEDREHRLPGGSHRLSLDVVLPDGTTDHGELRMPIACEGRGLLTARRLVHEQIANQGSPLDLDNFFDLTFSLHAPALFAESAVLAHLPGVDLAAAQLVEPPSAVTSVLGWVFADQPRLEFPFWKPWSTVDGRYLSPLRLSYRGAVLVDGYVEVAPPRGLLAATGGIVGCRLWRPGVPEKYLEVRLVANAAITPSGGGGAAPGDVARLAEVVR